MTEDEADREASRLNRQLGDAGEEHSYWVAVEGDDGDWRVEQRHERRGWLARLLDAVSRSPDG